MENMINRLNKEEETNTVQLIGNRDIYLAGDITTQSISATQAQLWTVIKNIASQNAIFKGSEIGHINLHILSGGGAIHDMWALIDDLMASPIPIYTYAHGLVASAALKIFLAGAVRFVYPHTTLMYHDLSAGNQGKLQDIEEWKEYLKTEQQKIEDYVKTRTFMKAKQIKEIREKKKDFYMDADTALSLGFATKKFECSDWGEILHE